MAFGLPRLFHKAKQTAIPDQARPVASETPESPIGREYCYAGQGACLINKFSETNQQNLEWIENMISLSAYMREMDACINRASDADPKSIDGIMSAHKRMFGLIYDWAGEYRECRIAGRGQAHISTEKVPKATADLCDTLSYGDIRPGVEPAILAHELQEFCTQFNYVHPFVNGNGRTQMLLSVQLAKSAGYDLFLTPEDIALFDKARADMYAGDSSPLERIIASRLFREDDPSDLHQALKKTVAERLAELPSERELVRDSKNISYAILTRDPDYPRRRATGRTPPSFVQKILDMHGKPDGPNGPEL